MQQLVALALAVAFLGGCECNLYKNIQYDINSLLVCQVQNPLANLPGQPALVEGIETIPLVPGPRNSVWLPQESGYTPPIVDGATLDQGSLSNFLGTYLNGKYFNYMPVPNLFILEARSPATTAVPSYTVNGQPMLLSSSELSQDNQYFTEYVNYLENITGYNTTNVLPALTQFGIGNCQVKPQWTVLPPTFFPNTFSGGFCPSVSTNNPSCSIPAGMYCRPDLRSKYLTYMVVLRWDCCTTFVNNKWSYSCGWRKVQFPIVSKCFCGCDGATQPEIPFLG